MDTRERASEPDVQSCRQRIVGGHGWNGYIEAADGRGWVWHVRFSGPYCAGTASGWSATPAEAAHQAGRFAECFLKLRRGAL